MADSDVPIVSYRMITTGELCPMAMKCKVLDFVGWGLERVKGRVNR